MSPRAHPRPPGPAPRAYLRGYRPDDAEEFTAASRASRELHRPWLFPPEDTGTYAAYARRIIEDHTKAGFLVCERDNGRIAGFININNIVHGGFLSGVLGYGVFAHAAGRGLMSEGLGLVVRHAFGPMGLHRLEANIQPANAASLALVRRAGFRLEGCSPDFLMIDGAWRDHERWAITAEMVKPDEGVGARPSDRTGVPPGDRTGVPPGDREGGPPGEGVSGPSG